MMQQKLRMRILFGYIILVTVIGSMAVILIHEHKRMQETKLESTEIRKIRQKINTAHMHITGLVMLGESVISWEETDYLYYHVQRMQTDSLLQSLKSFCKDFIHSEQIDTLRIILQNKEEHLRHAMLMFEQQKKTIVF